MKYIDADKLKELLKERQEEKDYREVIWLIDSLQQEQPVEGPEEAAKEYAYRGIPDGMKSAFKPLADEIAKNFIAGAEWGAEHLKK